MRFGFHVSIAGGFSQVRSRAEKVKCRTVQFFCGNPRGWRKARLDPIDVARFREDIRDSGIAPVFCHASYLVNLAASDRVLARRSVEGLVQEAERCSKLGVGYLIVHVGRAGTGQESDAVSRVVGNVDRVLEECEETVLLLLENTAGMGSEVGYRFDQLGRIVRSVAHPDRVGVVLDTAHLFEAGYELRTRAGLDQTLRDFDRLVGFGRLHLLHLNDSKTGFGSRVDRHWHIGKGKIGRAGFRLIINHPLLAHLPAILETPRQSLRDDLRNLAAVRSLLN